MLAGGPSVSGSILWNYFHADMYIICVCALGVIGTKLEVTGYKMNCIGTSCSLHWALKFFYSTKLVKVDYA